MLSVTLPCLSPNTEVYLRGITVPTVKVSTQHSIPGALFAVVVHQALPDFCSPFRNNLEKLVKNDSISEDCDWELAPDSVTKLSHGPTLPFTHPTSTMMPEVPLCIYSLNISLFLVVYTILNAKDHVLLDAVIHILI